MYDREFLQKNEGRIPIRERLQSRVMVTHSNGCHIFTGGKDSSGYGRIKVGGAQLGAHKIAYLLYVGDYDQVNLELMHSCDNPACVNPEHLTPVSHKENMHDAIGKGRHSYQLRKYNDGNPTPRKAALDNGSKTYHGKLCDKHGVTERITVNGACVQCCKEHTLRLSERRRQLRLERSTKG